MLRRRNEHKVLTNDKEEFDDLLKSYATKSQKDSIHSFSSLAALLLIISVVLLFGIVVKLNHSTPTALNIEDEKHYPRSFIAERAHNHLKQLTSFGPKVAGSYENEVLAVNFFKKEINLVIQQANRAQKIELDHQKTSGSFFLDFKPYGLVNIYDNVQNIVVKVYAKTNSNHSLLINCHFDSVPTSPGASDDGIMCVSMLEVLRVLSREPIRPTHNIIFLFNGAEETPLQASHGFITHHKWAPSVRAVINLEATGAGGREILFQAGPGNIFLLDAYSKHAPHPFAQSAGEEIFQHNLIPADTDFRVFRDFGHVPGLDMAFTKNGYVYHTRFDNMDQIPLGSFQHVGDNLLGLVKSLGSSPDLPTANLTSNELAVYFDVFGLFFISYSNETALFINGAIIFVSIILILKMIYDLNQNSWIDFVVNVCLSGGIQIIGMLVSLIFILCFGFLLDYLNLTMSWYTKPQIILGLFMCPCVILQSIFLSVFNNFIKNVNLSLGTKAQIHSQTNRMIWTLLLAVSTIFAVRVSYVFVFPVLFNSLAFTVITLFKQHHTKRAWLYIYLFGATFSTAFEMYLSTVILELFIPITGFFGSNKNPEDYIGVLSTLTCLIMISGYVPLLTLIKKPANVIAGLIMTFVITLCCIAFTDYGFPYSADQLSPSPQRFWIYHTNRVFHDESGKVRKQDAGYFLLNMDRNSPQSMENFVLEVQKAISLEKDCKEALFCGLPVYSSLILSLIKESTWIPASPPTIHEPVSLKLQNRTKISPLINRYFFRSSGPDRYTIYLSPKKNAQIHHWSFMEEIPTSTYMWESRPTYFILYAYGERANHFDFWVDVQLQKNWSGPALDIAISGKYTHHNKTHTAKFREFLKQFPNWTDVQAYVANYHSWIY